jgi:DNA-binding MarR family transcriptional regulator
MKPLSYTQKRWLSYIEANPGCSRSELGKALFAEMNPYYSVKQAVRIIKCLQARGLVELGDTREGGRYGVPGVYLVGQKRKEKKGYLGVYGWVDT